MKILNLYAGIGGNRKLWNEVADVDVTAIELDEEIAEIYHDKNPEDEIIVNDAHSFLQSNYSDYDFIWSSPPCPTHSRIRNFAGVGSGQNEPLYPDMRLYEEVIFLKRIYDSPGVDFNGNYCVENVKSYYRALIRPQTLGRHYFWASFSLPLDWEIKKKAKIEGDRGKKQLKDLQEKLKMSLEGYDISIKRKVKLLRNCVMPELGRFILEVSLSDENPGYLGVQNTLFTKNHM